MALALYRKYRPAAFAEVVGQEHVTEPLSTALAAGRINHAYLFSGPRGCGKTSSARILARSLNCVQGPTPKPCGVCASCVALAPDGPGNIDVTELDAASHGGVDDTRELRDRASYTPAESRYRVFIVDEAHMITTQGFNALLKIVEEPPEHLIFVFATTEPDKVLPTIRSRTHHYPFRLIPPGTLRGLLERICAEEGAVVAPVVFPLVLRAGGGSARDSLSLLDQLLAGAGPEGVTYERAVALLGVTDVALIDDMVDALAAGDRAAVFETVDRLVEAGHDPRRFASDLLQRLRDVTLLQAVPEAAERGLVEAADDEVARIVEQADRIGPATLARYGEIVHTGLVEMRGATAPRLLLELLCARMLLPAAAEDGMLERLERLERRYDIAASSGVGDDAGGASGRTFQRPSSAGRAEEVTASNGASDRRSASEIPARPTESPGAESPGVEASGPGSTGAGAPGAGAPEFDASSADAGSSSPAAASGREPVQDSSPPDEAPVPTRQPSGLDAAAVRRVWPEILAAAKERKKRTAALLVSATVRAVESDAGESDAVENDTLVLGIGTAPLARLLSEQSNTDVIAESLHAVLGVRWRVRCEHGDGGSARAQATPAPTPPRRPPPVRRSAPDTGDPLPPEPPEQEPPPDDEESMLAEATSDARSGTRAVPAERRDPEEAAIELLSSQLGARTLDQR